MSTQRSGRFDVYRAVTNTIVSAIGAGAGSAECPWHRQSGQGLPSNALTSKPYHGINIVVLWAAAMTLEYTTNLWGTYRQWKSLGAQVRKNEHSSPIVFYKEVSFDSDDPDTGERKTTRRMVARASRVFNADQVDGYERPHLNRKDLVHRIARVEGFVNRTGATIRHGGPEALYHPASDCIAMPPSSAFVGTETSSPTESYYAVLLHELVHWTGARQRLARDLSGRFGGMSYAMEELVAELGAAFLCSELEIALTPRPDHAAYIESWLKVLQSDTRAVFSAAAKAAEATGYLSGLQSLSPGERFVH